MSEMHEDAERFVDKLEHLLDCEDDALKVCMVRAMDMTHDESETLRNLAKCVLGLYLLDEEEARRNAFVLLTKYLASVKLVAEWDYKDEGLKDLVEEKYVELAPWCGTSAIGRFDGKRFAILSEEKKEADFAHALLGISSTIGRKVVRSQVRSDEEA